MRSLADALVSKGLVTPEQEKRFQQEEEERDEFNQLIQRCGKIPESETGRLTESQRYIVLYLSDEIIKPIRANPAAGRVAQMIRKLGQLPLEKDGGKEAKDAISALRGNLVKLELKLMGVNDREACLKILDEHKFPNYWYVFNPNGIPSKI